MWDLWLDGSGVCDLVILDFVVNRSIGRSNKYKKTKKLFGFVFLIWGEHIFQTVKSKTDVIQKVTDFSLWIFDSHNNRIISFGRNSFSLHPIPQLKQDHLEQVAQDHVVRFLISLRKEISQPLWATCASAWPPSL